MYTTQPYLYSQTCPIVKSYTFESSSWPQIAIVYNRPAAQKWWFSAEVTQWVPLDLREKRYQDKYYQLDDSWNIKLSDKQFPLVDVKKIAELKIKIDSKTEKTISFTD